MLDKSCPYLAASRRFAGEPSEHPHHGVASSLVISPLGNCDSGLTSVDHPFCLPVQRIHRFRSVSQWARESTSGMCESLTNHRPKLEVVQTPGLELSCMFRDSRVFSSQLWETTAGRWSGRSDCCPSFATKQMNWYVKRQHTKTKIQTDMLKIIIVFVTE